MGDEGMKVRTLEGTFENCDAKFGVVAGRFNDFIVQRLLSGCLDTLRRHGVQQQVDVAWVPGALEIPLACQIMVAQEKYEVIIALGAVIRGDTPHFDYVASEVTKGVALVSLQSGIPIIFGVLTTDTIEQAITRAGVKSGNKGCAAAMSAIEMVSLGRSIRASE